MTKDRRSFLKTAGMVAAVTSAAPLALSLQPGSPLEAPLVEAAPSPRPLSAARFALELDGHQAGYLGRYSGGFPFGEVATFQPGSGGPLQKFIDRVSYEDITIDVGPGMSTSFWDWVIGMVAGSPAEKSGAILMFDQAGSLLRRLEFEGAWISEVRFPALDAASKDEVVLTIVISPETTELKAASGKANGPLAKQKLWQASNFRIKVGDLPTARVNKVDAFAVKQQINEVREGSSRTPIRVPGKLEYPNLSFTLSSLDSAPWFDYFKQFVLDGLGSEVQGDLELLAPDLSSELWKVTFQNLGIVRCALEQAEGSSDNLARIAVEMYAEGMALEVAV